MEVYGAFPGLMGVSIRAALPGVVGRQHARCAAVLGGRREPEGGRHDDDGAAIPGFWRTGLVQTPQADAIRFEALEVYARRGADQGQLTLNPVTSYLLDDDGVVGETLEVPLDGRDLWVRAPRGMDARGRFLGIRLGFDGRDDDARALPGLGALRPEEGGVSAAASPPRRRSIRMRPDESFRQITTWRNDMRLALESRQAAMEGLTLNPESPALGRARPAPVPTLPVPVPTGFQALGRVRRDSARVGSPG